MDRSPRYLCTEVDIPCPPEGMGRDSDSKGASVVLPQMEKNFGTLPILRETVKVAIIRHGMRPNYTFSAKNVQLGRLRHAAEWHVYLRKRRIRPVEQTWPRGTGPSAWHADQSPG